MANVTYLLGAGASAGKRSEMNTILEGLPCVNEITKRLDHYINKIQQAEFLEENQVDRFPSFGLNSLEDWENAKQNLLTSLEFLHKACQCNATIDTYAKKMVLQEKKSELEYLERLLTFYFILEQVIGEPDTRYDTFLANILQSRQHFPSNIKVLSWNYDSQLEIAYNEYDKDNKLNIGSKLSSKYQPFDILKLNGSATFQGAEPVSVYRHTIKEKIKKYGQKDIYDDIVVGPVKCILYDIVYLYQLYVGEIESSRENNTNLSFAFDFNKPSDILFCRADEIVAATDVLVIIGYTFPFFNREIDRRILSKLKPDVKIYIQDKHPNRIKQNFKAVKNSISDEQIELKEDTDQFFLPPEL